LTEPRYESADRRTSNRGEDAVRPLSGNPIIRRLSGVQVWVWVVVTIIIGLAVALRLVALDSDAYSRLSWSSALLTDEGFYIHNARNVVLFGTAQTDQFNNILIMPTLHAVQVVIFKLFGVGAIQARMISVGACLLTLPVFYAALHRVFGMKVALVATLFLALDHTNLLYSRLALMDTPAAALMICCLFALTRGLPQYRRPKGDAPMEEWRSHNSELIWTSGCGVLLGLTYATRGLTALVVPCFFVAVWAGTRDMPLSSRLPYIVALLSGLGMSLIVFLIVWYQPHHTEIARVNRYYINELLLPHSLARLGANISRGLFDYHRGTMPYLMRHTPIQFGLACTGMGWGIATGAGTRSQGRTGDSRIGRHAQGILALFAVWMLVFCLFLCCVSYAPSRYYVLFYPAMAVLSAFTLFEAPRVVGEILSRKLLLALLGSFQICLIGQVLRSRLVLIEPREMHVLFWGVTFALIVGSMLNTSKPQSVRRRYAEGAQPPEIWITGLALWAIVNCYWTGDWLLHLTYRQKAADEWLAVHLPAKSTVFGAVAPGLCLNNRLKTVNVIANLCNDGQVVEQFSPPRYIVILDGPRWREKWWDDRYPTLMTPAHRVHTFRNILRPFFEITVFAVDIPGETSKFHLYLRR